MKQEFEIGDDIHQVTLVRTSSGVRLRIGEAEHHAALRELGDGQYQIDLDGVGYRVWLATKGDQTYVHALGANWSVKQINPLERLAAGGAGGGMDTMEAPMPGTVISVSVKPGDAVHRTQTMMVIESMKMQTSINAWRDGVVAKLHYGVGNTFDRKAPLVTLEPAVAAPTGQE